MCVECQNSEASGISEAGFSLASSPVKKRSCTSDTIDGPKRAGNTSDVQNENDTREDAMLAFSFLHGMNMDQLKVLAKEWDVVKKGEKKDLVLRMMLHVLSDIKIGELYTHKFLRLSKPDFVPKYDTFFAKGTKNWSGLIHPTPVAQMIESVPEAENSTWRSVLMQNACDSTRSAARMAPLGLPDPSPQQDSFPARNDGSRETECQKDTVDFDDETDPIVESFDESQLKVQFTLSELVRLVVLMRETRKRSLQSGEPWSYPFHGTR